MANESFIKDIFRSFFVSFFRVVAIGLGIIALFIGSSILLRKPPTASHETSAVVIPNHEWKLNTLSSTAPTIVKVNIHGIIGLDGLTQHDVRTKLIDTIDGDIKQSQVKGVLLAINSPGGGVDDSDGIYRLLLEYKERCKVPVYAYVDGLCASGGMYIACAADKIYASEASLVGHVGVIVGPIFNFSELMKNLGVQSKTIFTGKNKDNLNPFRPWQPGEDAIMQNITDDFYQKFINIVSKHRPKLTREKLIDEGARVYPVEPAETLGYIDGTAQTIDNVLKDMVTELKIDKEYQVVELQSKNWLGSLFDGGEQALLKGKVEHTIQLPGNMPHKFAGKVLYLYCPEYQAEIQSK